MSQSKSNFKSDLTRYLLVILGSIVLGIGNGLFLVPFHIISGGLTGIALILQALIGFSEVYIDLCILILTWLFFFMGWIILGHKFALKTLISSIVYPLALFLGTFLYEHGILSLGAYTEGVADVPYILASLCGGCSVGLGCALTFLGGGSTGGVDVISLTLEKITNLKTSFLVFMVDATIIVLGYIFVNTGKLDLTVIGIISALCASLMIDKMFNLERNVKVEIISKKNHEINELVKKEINRGSTFIHGIGGYSKEELVILEVVLNLREYYILEGIISKIDPTAFVVVNNVSAVFGVGFKAHKNQNPNTVVKVEKKDEE